MLELLDQQFLLVNKVIMVLHADIASGIMLLYNLLLGDFKGSPIRHLLLLQVRIQSRITQHFLIVFGLTRFQLLVLLLQQQFKLLFVALLQVLLLVQKLIVLVPSCDGSLGTIFIQGLNDAIELITSHLVVDTGAGWVFETLQLGFQLLPHCFKLLHFLLLGKDFLGKVKHATEVSFDYAATRISILDVVDNQGAIATSRKEEVIVKGNTHSLDSFRVGLNLVDLFEVTLPDLD